VQKNSFSIAVQSPRTKIGCGHRIARHSIAGCQGYRTVELRAQTPAAYVGRWQSAGLAALENVAAVIAACGRQVCIGNSRSSRVSMAPCRSARDQLQLPVAIDVEELHGVHVIVLSSKRS